MAHVVGGGAGKGLWEVGGAALLPPLGSHCIVGETSYMTWRVNIVD